jgi:uncharacterized protein (TIGR02001 family)
VWTGIAQSAGDIVLQGGFDWDSGNGWYASIWGSGVDYWETDEARYASFYATGATKFAPITISSDDGASVELDFYVGYWGYIGGGYNTPYDLGVSYYAYPGGKDHDYYFRGTKPLPSLGGQTAKYEIFETTNYAGLYAGIGHYFLDDRVKTMWYLNYTNDYNGQNQDEWELYADNEVYLPYDVTLRFHAGYNWGEYYRRNLFGYNTNPGLSLTDASWGFCGYTYAGGQGDKYGPAGVAGTATANKRWADCVNTSGDQDGFYDWGVGLSRSFGPFDFTLDYIWVTGIKNEEMVKTWWSGTDMTGANEIYTDGQLVGAVKMAL